MISFEIPLGIFSLLSGVILIMDYGHKPFLRIAGIVGVLIGITSFFHCCTGKSSQETGYEIAHGYFVRNDINIQDIPTRIDNSVTLEKFFGTAAVMGKDGMPTEFDFSKSSVIPIVLDSTDFETEIKVLGCTEKDSEFEVHYKVIHGCEQSYYITPIVLLVVKKLNPQTKVDLIEQK